MSKFTRVLVWQAVKRTACVVLFLALLFYWKRDPSLLIIPGGLSFLSVAFLFVWTRFISFEQTVSAYDIEPRTALDDFESAEKCGRFWAGEECFFAVYAMSVHVIPFARIYRMYRMEYTREIEKRTWHGRLISRDRHQYHALVILMTNGRKATLWGKKHDIEAILALTEEEHPAVRIGYIDESLN